MTDNEKVFFSLTVFIGWICFVMLIVSPPKIKKIYTSDYYAISHTTFYDTLTINTDKPVLIVDCCFDITNCKNDVSALVINQGD